MSSKRKQEEKHLQALKTVLRKECNKRCFECEQRGPTYVDVTIGSFVCTSCGGILRGLNPPHRIKSVSMATFTPAEITFIESRGNEFCTNVYLGKYDSRSNAKPESKQPGKLKYFMELKYEQKRWYIPPDQAKKPSNNSMNSPTNGVKNEKVKSLAAASQSSTIQVQEVKPILKQSAKVDNFLADFSTTSPKNVGNTNQTTSAGGFADFNSAFTTSNQEFDAFGDFTSSQQTGSTFASTGDGHNNNFANVLAPAALKAATSLQPPGAISKPVDKYADLGDLFSMENTSGPEMSSLWSASSATTNSSNGTTGMSIFGMANAQQSSTLLNSTKQQQHPSSASNSIFSYTQQPSVFGSSAVSNSTFSYTQQPSVFGSSAASQSTFSYTQQPSAPGSSVASTSLFSSAPQQSSGVSSTTAFGNMQQQSGFDGNNLQQQMPFGSIQSTTLMNPASNTTSQLNSTAMFGYPMQNTFNSQPSQQFPTGQPNSNVPNPFMHSTAPSTIQPAAPSNPFMAHQQPQNTFPAQSGASNPFMNNPNPPQKQTSTNPFF